MTAASQTVATPPGDATKFLDGTGAWTTPTAAGVGAQPADSDLTAIAALSTTTFGRSLLVLADAAAGRTAFGLGTAATAATGDFDAAGAAAAAQAASQPLDSDLTAIAALSTTAYGRSLLTAADAAAAKTLLALAKGDVGLGSVDNTADAAKNVLSATKLTTARAIDGQSFDGTADVTVIAPGTHAATSKATPVDADEVPLVDSAASFALKKLTWANVKATLKTYFDGLYAALTHTHAESDVTSLTTDLAAKVPTTRTVNGHALSADVTVTKGDVSLGNVTNDAQVPLSTVTTKGDLLAATASATVARLAAGADGTVPTADSTQSAGLKYKFPTRVASEVHSNQSAVNTVSETVVATHAIPTTVVAGDLIRLTAVGDMLNNSGASVNYTLKGIVGATAALTGTAIAVAAGANRHIWKVTIEVLVAATNDERVSGLVVIGPASTATWPSGAGTVANAVGRGTATEDLTAGKSLQLSVTMGTANANADFICRESSLEIVKR